MIRQCDRTKPCSACCASGNPKECEFKVGEGNDYSPIQQSYEIRKLRQENLELKKELQKLHHRILTNQGDIDETSTERQASSGLSRVPSTARQKRFKTGDKVDNLYFGTPGLASVVSDVSQPASKVKEDNVTNKTVRKSANRQPFIDTHPPTRTGLLRQRRPAFLSFPRSGGSQQHLSARSHSSSA